MWRNMFVSLGSRRAVTAHAPRPPTPRPWRSAGGCKNIAHPALAARGCGKKQRVSAGMRMTNPDEGEAAECGGICLGALARAGP